MIAKPLTFYGLFHFFLNQIIVFLNHIIVSLNVTKSVKGESFGYYMANTHLARWSTISEIALTIQLQWVYMGVYCVLWTRHINSFMPVEEV